MNGECRDFRESQGKRSGARHFTRRETVGDLYSADERGDAREHVENSVMEKTRFKFCAEAFGR